MEGWLQDTVEDFWAKAGPLKIFPRNLEESVLWALPLSVVKKPQLCIEDVGVWLEQYGIPFQLCYPNRPLYGCLVAYAGHGLVLLDETDAEDESRFSLAHEIAHFLVDYLRPRRRAIAQLGNSIQDVFDGQRLPTVEERINAILSNTPLGFHVDFMERQTDGALSQSRIIEVENRADCLALELIAPATEVQRRVTHLSHLSSFQEGVNLTICILASDFGLPQSVAEQYGKSLYRSWYHGPSIREWLGI